MKTHKIYRIVNDLNDKVYIGYTSKSLQWRLNKHFEETKKYPTSKRKIHQAIHEIGPQHFSIEPLFESASKTEALAIYEQQYIEEYDSINTGYNSRKGGGGVHITDGSKKKVDVYDRGGNFIRTFLSRAECAEFIGCSPPVITTAITNADNGRGSQVQGYWVCHHGHTPIYKIPNTLPGSRAAKKKTLGKKRPEHSNFMKKRMKDNQDKTIYVFHHNTEGTFTGTRIELIQKYPHHNISNSELGVLIKGKYKSHRGWSLAPN